MHIDSYTSGPSSRKDASHSLFLQLFPCVPHLSVTLADKLRRTKLMNAVSVWMISLVSWYDAPYESQ
jgi:hypothetical protein